MTSGSGPAFLDVERSVSGKRWRRRLGDERAALAISQRYGHSELLARVLAGRGVGLDEVESFLRPTLRDLLPDPSRLRDMDRAAERVVAAIEGGERIGVFADYDVDGAASAALLVKFLAAIGREASVYVPDRLKEGYGPNAPALRRLAADGVSLVITVDCGTTAFAALGAAREAGLDVIVLDHHVPEEGLPEAVAVVNPNRPDDDSGAGQLCAAGVTFLFVVAVNRALRRAHWYGEGHGEPDLMAWLDLVALATVADVVPLTGVNRALVRQGLAVMARRRNPGLAALADVARISAAPEAWHLGFLIGPRVNAGGRVGEAGLGARLLTARRRGEADAMALRLDRYNTERRDIEAAVLDDALKRAEAGLRDDDPLVMVAGEGWHPGVIGIVASRLKDIFDRPACVVALDDEVGRGSGRSVRGVGLGPAVIAAYRAGLLRSGGGHVMAAGFSVARERLSELRAFLAAHVSRQLAGRRPRPEIGIDGALRPEAATPDLVDGLSGAGPFGAGNPRPRFALPAVRPVKASVVGGDHVRCWLASAEGGGRLPSIAFRSSRRPVGAALLNLRGDSMHVAGHLDIDAWRGERRTQMVIEDVALADG